jgi:hypothetical protein
MLVILEHIHKSKLFWPQPFFFSISEASFGPSVPVSLSNSSDFLFSKILAKRNIAYISHYSAYVV